MKLARLRSLHEKMQKLAISTYRFVFEMAHLTFEVIFIADMEPMQLLFGCVGHVENIGFVVAVKPDYTIDTYIHPKEMYLRLSRAFRTHGHSGSGLKTSRFFAHFHSQIPGHARREQTLKPHEIARYRNDVPEPLKIYFYGWLHHSGERRPSELNLSKTGLLISQKVAEFCRQQRISSCWTDRAQDGRKVQPINEDISG